MFKFCKKCGDIKMCLHDYEIKNNKCAYCQGELVLVPTNYIAEGDIPTDKETDEIRIILIEELAKSEFDQSAYNKRIERENQDERVWQ